VLNILVLHWGRTGAGPIFTYRLAETLGTNHTFCTSVSFSTDADISSAFEALPLPKFPVKTFTNTPQMIHAVLKLPWLGFRLRRFLRTNKIDVVVVGMDQVLQAPLARLFSTGETKYLHVLHDGQRHLGEDSRIWRILRQMHYAPANGLIVLSDAVRDQVAQDPHICLLPVFQARLPASLADPDGHYPVRTLAENRPVSLGMFGRAMAYKGFDVAADACERIRAQGTPVTLTIIGKGADEFVGHTQTDWLRVEDRWVPEGEVLEILQKFDIILLPYKEASQSAVLAECTALGIPAVVTPVGGIPGQVLETGCGIVSEAISSESIADAVLDLINTPGRYEECSRAGILSSHTIASWEKVGQDVARAILSVRGKDDDARDD